MIQPAEAATARQTFAASSLPSDNSGFGEKTLRALYRDGTCSCTGPERQATLFFWRDDLTNPLQDRPNWALYWKDTSAGGGIDFTFVEEMPSAGKDRPSNAIGGYEPYDGALYLTPGVVKNKKGCFPRPDGSVDYFIDCFANTLRHEDRHRQQLVEWWGQQMNRYICDDPICADDWDLDLVPNDVEVKHGCNPRSQLSCPTLPTPSAASGIKRSDLTDLEFDAYEYGWKWQRGKADKEDWSCPGPQCDVKE